MMSRSKPETHMAAVSSRTRRSKSPLPFKPLDKSSYIPMYAQIQTQLRNMIQTSKLKPGDALPSEEELGRVYGISRMTARQALQGLKMQGLAARHKGLGTFVTQPKVEKDIAHLCGFTAEMQALGMKPSSQVLSAETTVASESAASSLAIKPGAPVFCLRRLRFADGSPLAVEESTLSLERFPGIEKINFARHSLYATLRQNYGVHFALADEILEAHAAGQTEARLLNLPLRSCLLIISRVLWSADNQPLEMARSLYRGDRYRAVLRIPARTVK
jgi:GntR family transcriptional regulator